MSTSSFQLRMSVERWARMRLYTPPLAPARYTLGQVQVSGGLARAAYLGSRQVVARLPPSTPIMYTRAVLMVPWLHSRGNPTPS